MNKRTHSLRASFVVTIAAVGSMVGGGCADTIGPGATTPDGCPEAPPQAGDPCGAEGQFCGYGVCNATENSLASRVCQDGRWTQSFVSCNPPSWVDGGVDVTPDPTPTNVCPAAAPADGAPCAADAPLTCSWGSCEQNGSAGFAMGGCAEGTWRIFHASCNPPQFLRPDAGTD